MFRTFARASQEASGVNGVRRSRKNHRARFLPTVVRGCRTFTYHADGQLASASCDGIGRAGAHASSDIASQCSLRSGDMRTPPSPDTQWRKSESLSHIAIIDGDIWLTQTNIVSCSDSSIAPLVTSSARQLTGLTAAFPSCSRSFDVRGNVTVSETLVDSSFVTSRQTVPYATNKPLAISRYGIVLMDVSVSAVTNTVAYDSLGRQISNTDGRGNTTHVEYNAFGQHSASIDALGNRTTYAYDQFGQLSSVTDPLGHATIYEYDLRGRKTYEGGATYPVRYTYDVFGNKTTMMTYRNESLGPDSGDVTTWLYDEASGAMTNKVYADGKGPTYSYTPEGKLSRRVWARGIVTDYTYDGWGNLTNTVYSDNTPTISITYDALGRQTGARDAAGVTTLAYNIFGSHTNETVIGVAGTNIIIRHWDNFGRDAGYALNGVRQTTLAYDPATARLSTMRTGRTGVSPVPNEESFSWSYLPGSDLKSSLTYPNGLTASWSYDANNQLLQVCNATPTNMISQYDYTCDAAGRRVFCAKSGSAFPKNDSVTYSYNTRSELTNAIAAADSKYRYSYDFDDIGNREFSSERGTNVIYSANNLNQYTAVDDFIPQFDTDGNQTLIKTATGIWSVAYNGENRPILWTCIQSNNTNNQTIISMSYDRMGRRVAKNAQRFVYDGYLQIADNNGNAYIWDPSAIVATRPLVRFILSSLGEREYYTHDGSKNVSDIILLDGEIIAAYEYAPFGAVTALHGVSATHNPWRFSSEYAEDDTSTVYYNYRHYGILDGRWIGRDEEGESGGLGLYTFVGNNFVETDYLGNMGIPGGCNVAVVMLIDAYMKMRKANTRGADKWFHCMGMCRASYFCPSVRAMAILRELVDHAKRLWQERENTNEEILEAMIEQFKDSLSDMEANETGISCPFWRGCKCCCEKYLKQAPSIRPNDWF